jgi:prepilin-type N-terminal cleavage/methylation domain-containing protein
MRSGFSLVELLVVVGIAGVLMAALIPATTSLRRSARVAHCASNIRQIGQALHAYRSERRTWPVAMTVPAPFDDPRWRPASSLPEALADFLPRGGSVYRCPGDDSDASVYERSEAVRPGNGTSYIYLSPTGRTSPIILLDFLGYDAGDYRVDPPRYHGPYAGARNALDIDGSVQYKSGRPARGP